MPGKVLKKWYQLPVRLLKTFFKTLLDFIYPPVCHLCNNRLGEAEEIVCGMCWEKVPRIAQNPFTPATHTFGTIHFQTTFAVWQFGEQFQRIIHLYKYDGYSKLGHQMGKYLAELVSAYPVLAQSDLLVPVPLHSTRRRERGYNQSYVLCQNIARHTGLVLEKNVIMRIRNTKTQTQLNVRERAENVANAFRVKKSKFVQGKRIILVDDVYTTGATINSCAATLKQAGAVEIFVLTAARV